jgi:hypothetical protein
MSVSAGETLSFAGSQVVISIIIGIVFIIGGLSGRMVLIGTQSGGALAAFGVAMIVWGIVKIGRNRS